MDNFIPLSAPHLRGNELKYVSECITTEWVSSAGSFVDRFEKSVAEYVGAPHAVSCVNGTAALHLALLLAEVKPNDEVIVPTITFIAPANTVRYVGAEPVFLDCDEYLNLDPEKLADFFTKECALSGEGLKNRQTGRIVKAVITVHVFGHPANLVPIASLCKKYNVKLIEDATESVGSFTLGEKGERQHTGTIGDIGCLSFNGNKIITTGGGGMIVTRDAGLGSRTRHLTTQAKEDPLYSKHDEVGFNYRLTNIQSALGVAQMEQLENFVSIKRRNFQKYREALSSLPLRLINEPAGCRSNYWHYSLVVEPEGARSRDSLLRFLLAQKIECRPVWHPVHLQKPYRSSLSYRIERATWFAARVINIPCSISLTDDQIAEVSQAIRSYYGKN